MNKDEKILEYLNLHINRLWTGLIILIGGLASLLVTYPYSMPLSSPLNIVKFSLFILGLFFLLLMIIGLANASLEVKNLLKGGKYE